MKRLAMALALGVTLALMAVVPAAAQTDPYGGEPPGPPDGCPVSDPPPEDPPPCTPIASANASDTTVTPGQAITVSTPPVFAPGSAITVNFVNVNAGETAATLSEDTANSEGAASESVTIPETPPGVYFMYVMGLDSNGNRVVAIVAIVVEESGTASAQSVGGQQASVQSTGTPTPVPAEVAQVQSSDLTPEAEAAVVDAVTAGDAGLVLSPEGELNVRTPQGEQSAASLAATGNDISTPVTAGAALILAGTGLVLLRRRQVARR